MKTALPSGINERTHQESADSLPPYVRGDINRILGRELITLAIVIPIQRAPTDDTPGFGDRDEHGKIVLHVVLEPGDAMLQRARFVIVARGSVRHGLVVNFQNAWKIVVSGRSNFHWARYVTIGLHACRHKICHRSNLPKVKFEVRHPKNSPSVVPVR